MSQNSNEQGGHRSQRRAFFGQVFMALSGGFFGGSILQKLLNSRKRTRENEGMVKISINPLAVPRSKEGSKSNV